ncbi:hypothetical protein FHX48_001994 [Microbacterium halimionae]|uniref:LPXTG-motif cell wall anchor domain-containing protein n=1 Tax=Microbacterium halimionae TaxID=1526413 RepID=A0A7W3JQ45_9MICO|nr:hypothetical protein [Microbacterium halimionae]MBA8816901.1 hypothetical protein [Microbacterium halimionae]NII94803.1 hypothetical protein [Microbacterium halimionae]
MKNLRTKIAAVAIAVVALIAAPAAANAYTPSSPTGTVTITPGGTSTVQFGGFEDEEPIVFTLTGENGAGGTLSSVRFVVNSTSITKAADEDGDASVAVTLPANASGSYSLAAVGQSSGASAAVTIDSGVAAGSGTALPATGFDTASMTGIWVGGGVLLMGGIAVTVIALMRRRQTA